MPHGGVDQRLGAARRSRALRGRSSRAWNGCSAPNVSITTDSSGTKPSTSGTAARTSSGVRAVRVAVVFVMARTLPRSTDAHAHHDEALWKGRASGVTVDGKRAPLAARLA